MTSSQFSSTATCVNGQWQRPSKWVACQAREWSTFLTLNLWRRASVECELKSLAVSNYRQLECKHGNGSNLGVVTREQSLSFEIWPDDVCTVKCPLNHKLDCRNFEGVTFLFVGCL